MFDITDEAETYIAKLFEDQDETDLALKVDVEKAGTPVAAVTFNFCYPKDLTIIMKSLAIRGLTSTLINQTLITLRNPKSN